MMAVPVDWSSGAPEPGSPQVLFEHPDLRVEISRTYSVAADGSRFLMFLDDDAALARQVRIVTNWFQELEAKLPRD